MVVAADTGGPEGDWREVHPILREPFLAVCPKGRTTEDLPLIQYTARHLMGRQIAAHLAKLGLKTGLAVRAGQLPRHPLHGRCHGRRLGDPDTLALHQARRFRDRVDAAAALRSAGPHPLLSARARACCARFPDRFPNV